MSQQIGNFVRIYQKLEISQNFKVFLTDIANIIDRSDSIRLSML